MSLTAWNVKDIIIFYYSKRNSGFFVCLTRLMIHRARFLTFFFQQFFFGLARMLVFFSKTFCVGKSLKKKFFMAYREKNGRDHSNFLEFSSKKRSKMGLKLCLPFFAFCGFFSRKKGHFYMTTEGFTLDFTRWDFLVLSKKKDLQGL